MGSTLHGLAWAWPGLCMGWTVHGLVWAYAEIPWSPLASVGLIMGFPGHEVVWAWCWLCIDWPGCGHGVGLVIGWAWLLMSYDRHDIGCSGHVQGCACSGLCRAFSGHLLRLLCTASLGILCAGHGLVCAWPGYGMGFVETGHGWPMSGLCWKWARLAMGWPSLWLARPRAGH
jgi:hypothetical protein